MLPEFGYIALIGSLLSAILLVLIPLFSNQTRYLKLTSLLTVVLFLFALSAITILAYSFAVDDFSIYYVASHSNTELPLIFKIAATWGGHEGSMLFWLLTLSFWIMLYEHFAKQATQLFKAQVVAVLAIIYIALALYTITLSDPFSRLFPAPFQGRDLNPMLQDIALILHPPLLYLGYIGFAVNFALAIVTLLTGGDIQSFAKQSRPWALWSWGWLTAGIVLGAWWAYYELGWGGWWFWDPVENSSLIPWLLGLGLMHSLIATQRKGLFPYWSLLFAILVFCTSLLGTFVVRSGVITSVHAFSLDSSRGYALLIMFFAITCISLFIFALKANTDFKAPRLKLLSQPTALLLLNILTAIATFSVILGTFYPIIFNLLDLGSISVGAPYFNKVFAILLAPCLFIMGFWLLVQNQQRSMAIALNLGAMISATIFARLFIMLIQEQEQQDHWYWQAFIFVSLGFYLLIALTIYLIRKIRSQQFINSLPMLLGHLGVGVVVLAAVMSSYYSLDKGVKMKVGETQSLSGYQFTFKKNEYHLGPNYTTDTALLEVNHFGKSVMLFPEKRFYDIRQLTMSEVAIEPGFWGDLYVVMGDKSEQNYSFGLHYKPIIRWLWSGGILMVLGAFLAVFLTRRKKHDVEKV